MPEHGPILKTWPESSNKRVDTCVFDIKFDEIIQENGNGIRCLKGKTSLKIDFWYLNKNQNGSE